MTLHFMCKSIHVQVDKSKHFDSDYGEIGFFYVHHCSNFDEPCFLLIKKKEQ